MYPSLPQESVLNVAFECGTFLFLVRFLKTFRIVNNFSVIWSLSLTKEPARTKNTDFGQPSCSSHEIVAGLLSFTALRALLPCETVTLLTDGAQTIFRVLSSRSVRFPDCVRETKALNSRFGRTKTMQAANSPLLQCR